MIQSFVVIAGMLILMELCVRVRDKSTSFMISSSNGPNRRRMINGKQSVRRSSANQSSIYSVSSPLSASQIAGVSLSDSCSYQNLRPTTRLDVAQASNGATTSDNVEEIQEDPRFRYESLSTPSCNIKSQYRYQSLRENTVDSKGTCWNLKRLKCELRLV